MQQKTLEAENYKRYADRYVSQLGTVQSTQVSSAVPTWPTSARHKFNVHFVTFWHLTHLASTSSGDDDIRATWKVTNVAGREFERLSGRVTFKIIDIKITDRLKFMEKMRHRPSKTNLAESAISIIENYDKCLELIDGPVSRVSEMPTQRCAIEVCEQLVQHCDVGIESFKKLPLLWNYIFTSRIHQLLILAKDCYPNEPDKPNKPNEHFAAAATLSQFLVRHIAFTATLREHFHTQCSDLKNSVTTATTTDTVSSITLVDSKLFLPVVPLDALINTLSENTECAAKQIPTAVTAIVHDYCCIDLFDYDDMDILQSRVVEIHKKE